MVVLGVGGMGGGTGTGLVKVLPIKIRHYVKLFCRLLNMKKKLPSWVYFCVYPVFYCGDIVKKCSRK